MPAPETGSLGIVCRMANEAETAVAFVRQVLRHAATLPYARVRMFVVLDRASADETRALLEAEADRESRLDVVWAPENRGVVDAYVCGYRGRRGAPLVPDDRWTSIRRHRAWAYTARS